MRPRLSVSLCKDTAERSVQVLSAAGVGWPDGGMAAMPGVTGLGWPGRGLVLPSAESPEQVLRGTSVNGQEDVSTSGSDRVRTALAAAVSRGTSDMAAPAPSAPR